MRLHAAPPQNQQRSNLSSARCEVPVDRPIRAIYEACRGNCRRGARSLRHSQAPARIRARRGPLRGAPDVRGRRRRRATRCRPQGVPRQCARRGSRRSPSGAPGGPSRLPAFRSARLRAAQAHGLAARARAAPRGFLTRATARRRLRTGRRRGAAPRPSATGKRTRRSGRSAGVRRTLRRVRRRRSGSRRVGRESLRRRRVGSRSVGSRWVGSRSVGSRWVGRRWFGHRRVRRR